MAFGVIAVAYTIATLTPLLGGSWRQMERGRVDTGLSGRRENPSA